MRFLGTLPRRSAGTVVGLAGLWVTAAAVAAPVSVPASLSGAAQTFNTNLSVSGTLTGDGAGTFGAAGPNQLILDVPSQTVNLTLKTGGGNIVRNPVGSTTFSFDDVTLANPAASDTTINVLNGSPVSFSFNQIILNGTARLFSSTMTNPLQVISDITGSINTLNFTQDAGLTENGSLTGRLSGALTANLGLKLKVGLLTLPVNIDPIELDFDEPFSLPGDVSVTDLEPGGAFPRDALGRIATSLSDLLFNFNDADTFELIETGPTIFANITGSFALNIDLGLGDTGYNVEAVLPDVIVEETGCDLVGDANGDQSVGAADYAIWAAQFGQTGVGLSADFDGNGSVGAGDYALWAANFGKTCPPGGAGASVPEPSTLVLGALGLVAGLGLAIRKRR